MGHRGLWDTNMAVTRWSADVRHPVYATRVLCEVANERGVATREILAGTGIGPDDLDDPEAVVSAWGEIVAVRRLLARLPDDAGVGIDVGRRFTLTHLGLMGFAAMSCATLRELFTIAMRYFALTMLHIDIKLFEGADDCLLELNASTTCPPMCSGSSSNATPPGSSRRQPISRMEVKRYADDVYAEVSLDEEVLRPLLALVPVHDIAFGRAHTRLHIPRAMFDEPLPQADSHTLELCIAQCDVLMQRYEQRRGITAVVRTKLFRDSGRFRHCPTSPPSSTCIRGRCGANSPRRARRFARC